MLKRFQHPKLRNVQFNLLPQFIYIYKHYYSLLEIYGVSVLTILLWVIAILIEDVQLLELQVILTSF